MDKGCNCDCVFGYLFANMDWAKMDSIEDYFNQEDNSPIKYLVIRFSSYHIFYQNFISEDCYSTIFDSIGGYVNYVLFPYRNKPGVRNRLIKTIRHLSDLEKEAAAFREEFLRELETP
jgi:hypothetical protein